MELLQKNESNVGDNDVTFTKPSKLQQFITRWKIPIFFGVVVLIVIIIVIAVVAANNAGVNETYVMQGCKSFDRPTVILIGIDGFMAKSINSQAASNITFLAKSGVEAEYLLPQYPTSTFPNFYSLATGLYPESHGIVSNNFYEDDKRFGMRVKGRFDKSWWDGGEPIWMTAKKNGVKSASFFWVGSEANEMNPDYWLYYDGKIPFLKRIDKVLEWIDMKPSERPSLITLYFNQPDKYEHSFGTSSNMTDAGIKMVDEAIYKLRMGLEERNITNCTNLVMVSDHGMADIDCRRTLNLDKFMPPDLKYPDIKQIGYGASSMAYIPDKAKKELVMNATECYSRNLRTYDKEENKLPVRLHYSNNKRIGDVIFMPNAGYSVVPNNKSCNGKYKGSHGYDNVDPSMRAFFVANGPAFKQGVKVNYFSNVQVYNLLAGLLGVKPAPTNGTLGYLNHILTDPKKFGTTPKETAGDGKKFQKLKKSEWPNPDSCKRCICPYCDSDILTGMVGIQGSLNITSAEESSSLSTNLPYGVPVGGGGLSGQLLVQRHYVTGYNGRLHVPIWVAYHLTKQELTVNLPRKDCFRRDIRLQPEHASNCTNYVNSGYDRGHLAPNGDFNFDRLAEQDTAVLSNIAPMDPDFNRAPGLWGELENFVRQTAMNLGELSVISGSIFDQNNDGIKDEEDEPKTWLKDEVNGVAIPTHFFKILTWCDPQKKAVYPHPSCSGAIEVLSFILPHQAEKLCSKRSNAEYLVNHIATVDDVERMTGINFFPELSPEAQGQIESKLHVSLP